MTTDPFDDFLTDHPHAGQGLPRAEQQFRRTVDECAVWVAGHGRLPKQSEQPWGKWLSSRRQETRKGRLSPERRAYLNRVLPGWDAPSDKSDEHFFAQVDGCAAWVAEHGRMPKRSDAPWGTRLNTLRYEARNGHLAPERRAYLDRALPGWDRPGYQSDEHFFAQVDGCAAWVAEHGRMPKTSDAPWGPWLIGVRSGSSKVTAERRAYLSKVLPDWNSARRKSDEHFFAKADSCAAWVAEHGRMPKTSDAPWGPWLTKVRSRSTDLGSKRLAYLDGVLSGWNAPSRRSDEHFAAQVDGCAAWASEHGRMPKSAEGTWGMWLSNVRAGARGGTQLKVDAARRAYLDARLPGWDTPGKGEATRKQGPLPDWGTPSEASNEFFRNKADECSAWAVEHGRIPLRDETPSGRWLDDVRNGTVRVTPQRRAYLDQVLPGWSIPAPDPTQEL